MPVARPIIRFCAGKLKETAESASSLTMLTKMLSTTLYSACTSIEIISGTDMFNTSFPMGMTPILFSAAFSICAFHPFLCPERRARTGKDRARLSALMCASL